jgi:hypothetical protein
MYSNYKYRAMLEYFFRTIINMIDSDNELKNAIEQSSLTTNVKKSLSDGFKATMSSVNVLLHSDDLQKMIWKKLKLPGNVIMPVISEYLLHGDISSCIYSPGFDGVYISVRSPPSYQTFFTEIINVSEAGPVKLILYDESKAARGDEIFGSP